MSCLYKWCPVPPSLQISREVRTYMNDAQNTKLIIFYPSDCMMERGGTNLIQGSKTRKVPTVKMIVQGKPQGSVARTSIRTAYPAKNTALFLSEYTVFGKTNWSRYSLSSPSTHEYVPFSFTFQLVIIVSYRRSCKPQTELKSSPQHNNIDVNSRN